jgi:hypothetical protein
MIFQCLRFLFSSDYLSFQNRTKEHSNIIILKILPCDFDQISYSIFTRNCFKQNPNKFALIFKSKSYE